MGSGSSKTAAKGSTRTATFLEEARIPISTTSGSVNNALASVASSRYTKSGSLISSQYETQSPSSASSVLLEQYSNSRSTLDLAPLDVENHHAPGTQSRRRLSKAVRGPIRKDSTAPRNAGKALDRTSSNLRWPNKTGTPTTLTNTTPSKNDNISSLKSASVSSFTRSNTSVIRRKTWGAYSDSTRNISSQNQQRDDPALIPFPQVSAPPSRASTISSPSTTSSQSSTIDQSYSPDVFPSSSTSYHSLPKLSPPSEFLSRRHTLMPARKPVPNPTKSVETMDQTFAEKLQLEEYYSLGIPQDMDAFYNQSSSSQGQRLDYDYIVFDSNGTPDAVVQAKYAQDELLAISLQYRDTVPTAIVSQKGKQREDADHALAMQIHLALIEEEPEKIMRDCGVCGESVPAADLPALMNCRHEPQTCADCYASWIASELESKGWRHIACPESKCKQVLEHEDVQRYSAAEVFLRFDALSAREALSEDPNFRWCRGPNCKSGQIHLGGKDDPIFTCIACGHKVCIVHEGTWHQGETCEEYDYRSSGKQARDQAAQEAASQETVAKMSKKCPGAGCVYNIQKTEGCDHMTCSRCRFEFCWLCLADYNAIRKKGNTAHNKGCTYHG